MNMTEWIQKQYVVAGIAAVCLVSMLVKWPPPSSPAPS